MAQLTELDRIKILIKWLIGSKIASNQEDLGQLLGYKSKSSFSQIINGHVPLPKKFIDSLYQLDPRINIEWIKSGQGEMLLSKKEYPRISNEAPSLLEDHPPGFTPGAESLMDSQARLIKIQEQLMNNNTKLVETNSKLTEQLIEQYNKNSQLETNQIMENVKKEIENIKNELKNAPARGDAKCADVG